MSDTTTRCNSPIIYINQPFKSYHDDKYYKDHEKNIKLLNNDKDMTTIKERKKNKYLIKKIKYYLLLEELNNKPKFTFSTLHIFASSKNLLGKID